MRDYRPFSFNAIWFLITVNVLIFIVTLVRPEAIFFLGLQPANFLHHPWTIISSMFAHGGFGHILCNMVSLYFLGSFLIRLVGEGNFLKLYFLGGVVGNLLFILLASPFSIGVGASGAVFALGGALVIITPKLPVFIFPLPIPIPLWIAILIFLLISFRPSIAWQAHLGGLIAGLIAGYFFKRKRRVYY